MTDTKTRYGGMRRFRIDRAVDPTGVSGTGCVAQGVVFSDGTAVVRWLGKTATTTVHDSIESVEAIHLHGGASKLRWEDPICFACGATNEPANGGGYWCSACGASDKDAYLETRPDPSLGAWSKALRIEEPSDAGTEERSAPTRELTPDRAELATLPKKWRESASCLRSEVARGIGLRQSTESKLGRAEALESSADTLGRLLGEGQVSQ